MEGVVDDLFIKGCEIDGKAKFIVFSKPYHYQIISSVKEVLSGLVDSKIWHPITCSDLCVGSTPTSRNADGLSQYDPQMLF